MVRIGRGKLGLRGVGFGDALVEFNRFASRRVSFDHIALGTQDKAECVMRVRKIGLHKIEVPRTTIWPSLAGPALYSMAAVSGPAGAEVVTSPWLPKEVFGVPLALKLYRSQMPPLVPPELADTVELVSISVPSL